MNRREFAAALAASAAAPCQGAPVASRIIDTHTHFYDPARPQGVPWPPRDDAVLYRTVLPRQYESMVRPLGVTGSVVIEASPWLEDNQWILDLARDDPFLVGFIGHLEPGRKDFARHLDHFRRNRLFLGIRVASGIVAEARPGTAAAADFARLAEAGMTLDVIGPARMLPGLAEFARRFPALRIVIDHLPLDGADAAAIAELGRAANVYAKVSGVLRRSGGRVPADEAFYRPSLDALWGAFGPHRAMYGSNWPVSEKLAPYSVVLSVVSAYFSRLPAGDREAFFWKNSRAAYRWVERSSR